MVISVGNRLVFAAVRRRLRCAVSHRRHRIQLEVASRTREDFRRNVGPELLGELVGIVIHNYSHAVHAQTVCLGHHALAEAVRNVVRAQQPDDHHRQVERHKRKRHDVPPLQHHALELDVRPLAPRQDAARVARRRHRRLDERAEVPAAPQLRLDAHPPLRPEIPAPLRVDLALEVEGVLLVGDVPGHDEEGEADPEQEGVDREEHAVVEEDPRPSDQGGGDAQRGGDGGGNQLGDIPDANDVGVDPDVEPSEQAEDQSDERISRELR